MRTNSSTTGRRRQPRGMRPSPVYEGHMSDGSIHRLSFWQPHDKPFDLAYARRLFTPGVPLEIAPGHWAPAHLEGLTLVNGYVEIKRPGKRRRRFADPLFSGRKAPVPVADGRVARPRFNTKRTRAVLAELVRQIEAGEVRESLLQQAREIAA